MTTDAIRCREAEAGDLPAVSRQVAESYRTAYRGLMEEDYLASLADDHWVPVLTESLAAGSTCILAEDGAEVVGSIVFGPSAADPGPGIYEIFALYLLPGYMGLGVGHRLYLEAQRRMTGQGAVACVAEALCGNTRSIRFCLAHGFAETGTFSVEENGMTLQCKSLRKEWRHPETIL